MEKIKNKENSYTLGIISDTHGLLRPGVAGIFKGVDLILHAGDVGSPRIIDKLGKTAPVTAVRGNMDGGEWAQKLPVTDVVEVGDVLLYIFHEPHGLDLNPAASGFHAVISGHTHKPAIEHKNGVLYLNPGSAGPRRFDYPVSVALLKIDGTTLVPQIITLDV